MFESTSFTGVQRPSTKLLSVLVIEDDAMSAQLIRLQLEAEGFSVLHTSSAEAALVLASRSTLSSP